MRPVGAPDPPAAPGGNRPRIILLGALAGASLAGVFLLKPIPQPASYHQFADSRAMLGIPNFLNVASNLPFLVAGLVGLCNVLSKQGAGLCPSGARGPWLALTSSFALTGIGSSYYHWAPSDPTLFWDRLPMAIGFGAVLGVLLVERVDERWGRRLWGPLLAAGVASLLAWRWAGDLRFYVLLQGWAILLVPVILLLFPGRFSDTRGWVWSLAFYALAKILEVADVPIYRLGGLVSGHTLKHLAAGVASGVLVHMLSTRRPRSELK